MPRPEAVLLDVGGVFLVPEHDRILDAFARGGFTPTVEMLDRAHYLGASQFPMDDDLDWPSAWRQYLDGYITACGVPDDEALREEVHLHLDSEFADAALWLREFPGARDGIRARRHRSVGAGESEQEQADALHLPIVAGARLRASCNYRMKSTSN